MKDNLNPLDSLEKLKHRNSGQFFLIAGPCVVENETVVMKTAESIARIADRLKIPFIIKSSYRKANRSRLDSFAGIGDEKALKILAKAGRQLDLPIVTDIHNPDEAALAAEYVDMLQIPAFLCRQTDLLIAAAKTGKVINIKKGQFLAPSSMKFAAAKVVDSGNPNIILTERGSMFGYGDLVVDFRGIVEMQHLGFPVVVDITHSLQQPNQPGGVSGGRPDMIETIGRAAIAAGADGIFLETHPNPSEALSDGANMLPLSLLPQLLERLVSIREVVRKF